MPHKTFFLISFTMFSHDHLGFFSRTKSPNFSNSSG